LTHNFEPSCGSGPYLFLILTLNLFSEINPDFDPNLKALFLPSSGGGLIQLRTDFKFLFHKKVG
jgi:hypothetical protein